MIGRKEKAGLLAVLLVVAGLAIAGVVRGTLVSTPTASTPSPTPSPSPEPSPEPTFERDWEETRVPGQKQANEREAPQPKPEPKPKRKPGEAPAKFVRMGPIHKANYENSYIACDAFTVREVAREFNTAPNPVDAAEGYAAALYQPWARQAAYEGCLHGLLAD